MGTGDFDVVSASGDSSLRMIYAGKVAPVNTTLLTNYADIAPFQKGQQWNSVDGVDYGIPHGWGANLLSWRTDKVTPAPDSWSVVWDAELAVQGQDRRDYDSPTYLARRRAVPDGDQARPGDQEPVRPRPEAVRRGSRARQAEQKSIQAGYWSAYADAQKAFENGTYGARHVLADHRQPGAGRQGAGRRRSLPKEGSTGWADTWMIDAKSPHPNCAYHVDELDHHARRCRRRSPSGSVRRRPTSRPAP